MSLLFMRDKHMEAHDIDEHTIRLAASFSDMDQMLEIRCIVSYPDLEIRKVDMDFPVSPASTCHEAMKNLQGLVGLKVERGYNRKVKEILGGVEGCVHMVDLAIELGHMAIQAKLKRLSIEHKLETSEEKREYFKDMLAHQCVTYR